MTDHTEDRYVIGRDGVFATLYDRQEDRVILDNSTEEHCRRVRADIIRAASVPDPADDNSGDGWFDSPQLDGTSES
jgi:hypothetical protein